MWPFDRFTTVLIAVCLLVWIASSIQPLDQETWFIEQVATLLCLAVLAGCWGRVQFSVVSKLGIAVLFCVHSIGTHFTYSLTPYDESFRWLFGFSLDEWVGWERNNYDRFVHFAYGVCLALPFKDALVQIAKVTAGVAGFFAFHLVLSTSAIYELIEWSAAVLFGGGAGMAYLGTQGDIWDAHADIALAGLGCLLLFASMSGYRLINARWVRGAPRSV